MGIQDPGTGILDSPLSNNGIGVYSTGGRMVIDVEHYASLIQAFDVDLFPSLCAEIPSTNVSNKQTKKAIDSNISLLDKCILKLQPQYISVSI
jgi:hypothetical protein